MAMNQQSQAAVKRLLSDLNEIQSNPILNVSALPLEDNIFEWHCNFRGTQGSGWEGAVFHVILFFPEDYPAKSPSAEFVPDFNFAGGASMRGKKGTKVCLSIFSDFAKYHTEWANEKGTGWSPSYTVQTVLLNLVSFLVDMSSGGYYGYKSNAMEGNVKLSKGFTCKDCGHSPDEPFPPLPEAENQQAAPNPHLQSLTCYITKQKFENRDKNAIFGLGICLSGSQKNPQLTSPCEFMTLDGFNALKSAGKVESVMREEIKYFLPMFINKEHGEQIKKVFETWITTISGKGKFSFREVIYVIPKLLNSTVVTFMNGSTHTSERALEGYFFFHQLFIWACDQYPEILPELEKRAKEFVVNPSMRMKDKTPNVGEWLAYLTVTSEASWNRVAQAYLQENFERNVMWYLKEKPELRGEVDSQIRLTETFKLTQVSRNLLAFQVLFLDISRPEGMSLQKVAERYEKNNGLPTAEMEEAMKTAVKKIKNVENYKDWFGVIKYPYPGDKQLSNILYDSVKTSLTKPGYFMTSGGGGGGGRGGRGRGRGGRR